MDPLIERALRTAAAIAVVLVVLVKVAPGLIPADSTGALKGVRDTLVAMEADLQSAIVVVLAAAAAGTYLVHRI